MSNRQPPDLETLKRHEAEIIQIFDAFGEDFVAELRNETKDYLGVLGITKSRDTEQLKKQTTMLDCVINKIGIPGYIKGSMTTNIAALRLVGINRSPDYMQHFCFNSTSVPTLNHMLRIYQSAKQLGRIRKIFEDKSMIHNFVITYASAAGEGANEEAQSLHASLGEISERTTYFCNPEHYRMRGNLLKNYEKWVPRLESALNKINEQQRYGDEQEEYQRGVDAIGEMVDTMKEFIQTQQQLTTERSGPSV